MDELFVSFGFLVSHLQNFLIKWRFEFKTCKKNSKKIWNFLKLIIINFQNFEKNLLLVEGYLANLGICF